MILGKKEEKGQRYVVTRAFAVRSGDRFAKISDEFWTNCFLITLRAAARFAIIVLRSKRSYHNFRDKNCLNAHE